MALPKKKTSKSRKGMRRAHHHVPVPNVIYCDCGEPAIAHRICPQCGAYNKRKYLKPTQDATD